MSDNWIILVPQKPEYVPPHEGSQNAVHLFQKLAPDSDEIEPVISDGIRFVDCGQNFEHVYCPDCKAELEIDWWNQRMGDDFKDDSFRLTPMKLPCCGAERNLNELRYEWNQGFAKFSLEAMNPNIGELQDDLLKEFEAVLGCPLKVIYSHV